MKKPSFYRFDGFDDFSDFIHDFSKNPGLPSELFSIGKSVQDRDIFCLRIGNGPRGDKPGALYISLTHGVEFIGGETNLAILDWFAGSGNANAVEKILSTIDVYFIPVLNPDAYDLAVRERKKFRFTFSRKNAAGVDLNRNFSVAFGEGDKHIWTGMPLKFMPVYRGPEAFSEPETRALRDFVLSHPIKTSLSFHSCGRMIGYPYCYKKDRAPDYRTLRLIALEIRRRMKHIKYDVMQEYDYVPTSGDTDDWLYVEGGVLPFLMELGRFGFQFERPETWVNPFEWVNMQRPHREIERILPGALYLAEWTAANADVEIAASR